MGSSYVRKTDRRRYEDRKFSIRAVHRDPVDLHKLAEVLGAVGTPRTRGRGVQRTCNE